MRAPGRVKGILVEGSDGHEYVLGFAPSAPGPVPVLSRRRPDGAFEAIEDVHEASRLARFQIGLTSSHLIGPGWGRHLFLWMAFKEALKTFPAVPSWPNLRG